jgi:NADH-quinone oxidoreductase subunit A
MLANYGQILIFILVSIAFVGIAYVIALLLAPKKVNEYKESTYECGEETSGETWIKFNIRFYVIALIFIIFDVEVVFLFPWAVLYKELGLFAFIEVAVFLVILILGYIYVYVKGDLQWDKPQPSVPKLNRQIFKLDKPNIK